MTSANCTNATHIMCVHMRRTIMRTKFIAVVAALGIASSLSACGSSDSSSSGSGPILLGAPTDESGDYALIGTIWKQGQNAAVSYINSNGGVLGRKLKIERQDLQSNPSRAAQVTNEMIQSKKYAAIIPSASGTQSGPIWEAINRAKTLGIADGTLSDLADPKAHPTAFEASFSPSQYGTATACMAPALGYKSVGILGLNDSYSQTEVKLLVAKFKTLGITVTGNEQMAFTDKSAAPQLQKLQAGKPQALIMVMYGGAVGVTFTGLKSIEWDPPVIGDLSVSTFPLSAVAKPASYPSRVYGLGTPASTRVKAGYTAQQKIAIDGLKAGGAKFDAALNTYAYGFDAVMIYKAAVEKAKSTDQDKVMAALESMKDEPVKTDALNQVEPQISADYHGLQNGIYSVMDMLSEFKDGTWAEFKPNPAC